MNHPNVSELDRKLLQVQAKQYLEEAKRLEHQNKFRLSLEAAEQAVELYHRLEKWEKCVESRQVVVGNLLSILEEGAKIFAYLDETYKIVLQYLEENHLLIAQILYSYGNASSVFGHLEDALEYHRKELKVRKAIEGEESTIIAHLYARIGNVLWEQNFHHEGLQYFEKGLVVLEKVSEKLRLGHEKDTTEEEVEAKKALIYIYYGSALFRMFFYEKALFYLNEALAIYQKAGKSESIEIGRVYYQLGDIYTFMGEYESALLFFKKLLYVSSILFEEDNPRVLSVKHRIAELLIALGFYEEALPYIETVIDVAKKSIKSNAEPLAQGYFHLAEVKLAKKDYDTALRDAEEALHLNTLYFGGKDFSVGRNEYLIGNIYALKNNQQKSLEYFQQSLDKLSAIGVSQFMEITCCLCSIAEVLNQQNKYREALDSIQKSLQISCSNFQESDIHKNPKLQDIPFDTNVLTALTLKAAVFFNYYQQDTQNLQDYEAALWSYQLVDELVCRLRQSYHSIKSKLGLSARIATENYSKGIYAALNAPASLDKRAWAFAFSEKAKGAILYASFQENVAKECANIPVELLQKEKKLKVELDYLAKSIQQQKAKGDKKNEELFQKFQNDYFNVHQAYKQLIQGFEQNYPDYYQLKYQTEVVSIEEIQANLTANQWMVSYFMGENRYYIFLIGKEDFEVFDFEKISGFEQLVEDFLNAIQNHEWEVYAEKGYELYQELLQPLEMYLIDPSMEREDTIPQLIIISHGILHYLPFEALICTRPKGRVYVESKEEENQGNPYQSLDYALLHFEVSYHYSATLWKYFLENKGERAPVNNRSFVGFAPVYQSEMGSEKKSGSTLVANEREGVNENLQLAAKTIGQWATRSNALRSDGTWNPLPHSKTEAQNIASLFAKKGLSAQIFLHEQATKERFREVVENSRFLLIAAHGVVNDQYPKLSGLVFFPPMVGGEAVENSPTPERFGDIWNGEGRKMSPCFSNDGESSRDCILSMEETYHLNLNADLVVLSSCESGIGELAKGEGMMAVNRGFLYAGARNVVSTLFKVYDRPSSLLTQYLFEGILEEMGYTEALRAAKLRLLKMERVDVKSWCGFVLIGGG